MFDRKAYMKEYNLRTKEKQNKQKRDRAKLNPGLWRRENLLYQYKLTLEDYDALLDLQDGVCAICGDPPEVLGQNLHVDHDHICCPRGKSCGECIRGLLCSKCNHGLGNFNDSIEKLKSAIEYLERWSL